VTVEHRWVGAPTPPAPPTEHEPEFKPDPGWNKLLIVVGVIVAVVAVLVVPGILNRGGKNPVADAAEATSNAPGVRVTFTGGSQGPGAMSLRGAGVMNGETDRAFIQMNATGSTSGGVQSFTLQEILDGGDLYMNSPELGSAFGGSARWLLMRSEVFGDLLQSDASGAGMSASPTQQLDALKDASYQVVEVGQERLNRATTTHYRALIDTDKLTDELKDKVSGKFGDLIEKSMDEVTSSTVDVWIDASGLLRRETSTTTMGSLGNFTMTMDFSHYGIHPDIKVPQGSEVFDVTPLMEKALDELSD
jgi:hypothetical protein